MRVQDILPWITGSAGALVVAMLWVYAFYLGRLHSDREFTKLEAENEQLRAENNQYRAALDTERKTVNETASAGQVTNQLINALASIAAERAAAKAPAPQGLTAKDIGL